MNGVHDMGGMHGMGAVPYEQNEPVFHEPWEARAWAMTRASRAWNKWNIDGSRHSIELLPAAEYLRMSYYERWFESLAALLVRTELITAEELRTGRPAPGSARAVPAMTVEMAARPPNRGFPSADEPAVRPQFRVGQRVRTLNLNPPGHTRLPRYARAKRGTIVRDHGVYGALRRARALGRDGLAARFRASRSLGRLP